MTFYTLLFINLHDDCVTLVRLVIRSRPLLARVGKSPPGLEVKSENMAASSKVTVVLKAVKKIAIQFCPFESNVRSTR